MRVSRARPVTVHDVQWKCGRPLSDGLRQSDRSHSAAVTFWGSGFDVSEGEVDCSKEVFCIKPSVWGDTTSL